ncbi:sugar transferase [Pseudoclavibacter sp. CFCC 13796]|uniref:sugar transferase n=1 Tax=Pseudoclavibacter sp. CFCC 13796 TaxID=2615179 RepID=UPI0013013D15|nr:sugar transferase [Pseudoclavibacter sp. CFCC 13796]KAB1661079.1 sugar transferase [Pseudoclavibacter sp. CFCC 13796]
MSTIPQVWQAQARAASAHRAEILQPFIQRLFLTDLIAIIIAMCTAHLLRFGADDPDVSTGQWLEQLQLSYLPLTIAWGVLWVLLLSAYHVYDPRYLGTGTEEYRNVLGATMLLFGGVAVLSYLVRLQVSRGYFLVALPVGMLLLLASHWLWRKWLSRRRRQGSFVASALIVGGSSTAAAIAREIASTPDAGLRVVGCCVANKVEGSNLEGTNVPVLGALDDCLKVADRLDVDTVVVTASRHLTPTRVRRISWGLETNRRHLALAPSLIDVAGPRIHMRPMANMSLVHVETPRFDGRTQLLKRAFDIVASGIGLVVLSPLFLMIAVCVKSQDGGPVFFKHTRVGRRGKHFRMWKFRSMRVNADTELKKLLEEQGKEDRPLFKIENDPRITRLGHFIRKTSIDELPQLVNVFKGDMSLVGPRPQVDAEVALYDRGAARRLNVRPGVTGLWQVSGRSDLDWEEAIRLDLYYVENWSFFGDLQILFRTFKAVMKSEGAY